MCRICAPNPGFVNNMYIRPGDYAVMGQPMFGVVESTEFWVAAAPGKSLYEERSDLHRFVFLGRARTVHIPTFKYAVKGALGIVSVF